MNIVVDIFEKVVLFGWFGLWAAVIVSAVITAVKVLLKKKEDEDPLGLNEK